MARTEAREPQAPRPDLASLLFGTYRHRVLSLLFLRPEHSLHVRMIARLTGVPAGSLHRELRILHEAGLLVGSRIGNQVHYAANQEIPVFHELAAMLEKTAGAPPVLQQDAGEYSTAEPQPEARPPKQQVAEICRRYGIKKMSLFGSAARGELRPESDIDLLVEFKPTSKTTLFDYAHLQDELSPLFDKRKIQISGPEILRNPFRRRTILPDLKVLYEG